MRDDGQPTPTTSDPAPADGAHPDAPWLHGTWQVARVEGGEVAGLADPPWLTFEGDGVVFGLGGVNRVRGTWLLDGDVLTFGPVVATLMAGPPQATDVERALLAVLAEGGTVERRPGAFVLRTPTGRAAELVRAPGDGPH